MRSSMQWALAALVMLGTTRVHAQDTPPESPPSDPSESPPDVATAEVATDSDVGDADPADSDPAESDPVESDPVESDPVESDPVESDPVESDPVESGDPPAEVAAPEGPAHPDSPRSACLRTARALGPSQAGFLDGMLGVPRRACLRSEVSLAGDAYLIARPADFYGNIRIGARVSGSVVVHERVEVWGSFEALRYQSLLSAVSSTYLGLGYLSLGTTVQLLDEEDRVWAAYVRTQLPTTTGLDQGSQPIGLELGTTAEWNAHPNLRLHGFLSLFGSVGVSELAPPLPRGGLRVGGGLDWIPYEWLSFMLEVQSGFGYRDGLDFLALSGGARLGLGDVIGVDLNVIWPFVGAELALAGAQLGVSGRLDGF